jgi:hypothetical protein
VDGNNHNEEMLLAAADLRELWVKMDTEMEDTTPNNPQNSKN